MSLRYIDQLEFKDKKVIARFDFNVPLSKDGKKEITDATRIEQALPSIKYILEQKPNKLILMSHLGRPKGVVNNDFSLEPVAEYLGKALKEDVILTETCTDSGIKTLLNLNESRVILLQNLRFHKEETDNDPQFAKTLAGYADIYVNDAFGSAHRKHASTYAIVGNFPKDKVAGGFLLKKEIMALSKVANNPEHPFVAIVGGAKVSDKIKIIESLLTTADNLLIGGAMAYPFLVANGHKVGKSLCSDEDVKLAKSLLQGPKGQKIKLPVDHLCSTDINGDPQQIDTINIEENLMGLDIGPQTIANYQEILTTAKTVLWNGPMGLFENSSYAQGTFSIAKTLSTLQGFTVVGGGDSVSAIKKSGLSDSINHVSTGGGASLEYIENGTLPGIEALKFGINN